MPPVQWRAETFALNVARSLHGTDSLSATPHCSRSNTNVSGRTHARKRVASHRAPVLRMSRRAGGAASTATTIGAPRLDDARRTQGFKQFENLARQIWLE